MKLRYINGLVLTSLVWFSLMTTATAQADYASHGMVNASPSEVYLHYLEVLHNAESIMEILPYSPRTQTQNQAQLEATSEQELSRALAMMQAMAPVDVQVLQESVDGNRATLEFKARARSLFDGDMVPVWGRVPLLRRQGEWKIGYAETQDTKPDWADSP